MTNDEALLLAIIDEVKERMVQGTLPTKGGNNNVVTASLLGEVVANLSRTGRDAYDESVQLLDAFCTPSYDPMRKNFELVLDKAS